jgi:beta-lactam-binding protein with PASTA domain
MGIRLDLNSIEGYVAEHLKLFISMAIGILVFVGVIAVLIFFIAVKGAEQTMVPDVRGKELTEALVELQVKELYPRIQLRSSQTSQDRGRILEQDPQPGSIVKAGRRIRLVVSQGVVISKVENYVGRDINNVRAELKALFSGMAIPLLALKEPEMFDYSTEATGTILKQRPEQGTDISGPIQLEFVVSKGSEDAMFAVPQFIGLSINAALEQIGKTGIDFSFSLRAAGNEEKPETVVYQEPPANAMVAANAIVRLTATMPDKLADDEVFTLFRYVIPANPYPLSVRLEALFPSGERVRIINVEYSGGEFTVPCKIPAGSVLILSMKNMEIYRETVSPYVEPLALDQL